MKVKNWETWQHYRKDRGTPPWIKVYRNLFSNQEWVQLTDSEKGQLVSIWILASDKSGGLPDDPMVIQKMCMLDAPPNINKFIDLGFLVGKWLSDGCQHDAPETETEGEMSGRQPALISPIETDTEAKPEEKKEAETDKKNTTSSIDDGQFEIFWDLCPKKVDKKATEKSFNRLTKKNQAMAIADIGTRYANTEKQYIPSPRKYVLGEKWDDEKQAESQAQKDQRFDEAIGKALDNNEAPPTREEFFNEKPVIEGQYHVVS